MSAVRAPSKFETGERFGEVMPRSPFSEVSSRQVVIVDLNGCRETRGGICRSGRPSPIAVTDLARAEADQGYFMQLVDAAHLPVAQACRVSERRCHALAAALACPPN